MGGARRSGGRRRAAALAATAVAAGGAGVLVVAAPADSRSDAVTGKLFSEAVTGPACSSPVGVCSRGRLTGALKGTFTFTATSVTATSDTPSTSVVAYTGDMVITTRDGTLLCKHLGALATTGDRSDAGVCTVSSGTGGHQGSTGRIRISGISPEFLSDSTAAPGEAVYEGAIAQP